MELPLFDRGDYVQVKDIDTNFIGVVQLYDDYDIFNQGVTYLGERYTYDVLIERNNQYIIMMKHSRAVAGAMKLLATAKSFAAKALKFGLDAHERNHNSSGMDYEIYVSIINQLIRKKTNDDSVLAVAYLADILTSTDISEERLKKIFPADIVHSVIALTNEKNHPDDNNLQAVLDDKYAGIIFNVKKKNSEEIQKSTSEIKSKKEWVDLKEYKKYLKSLGYFKNE